jgi:hypothetical protein
MLLKTTRQQKRSWSQIQPPPLTQNFATAESNLAAAELGLVVVESKLNATKLSPGTAKSSSTPQTNQALPRHRHYSDARGDRPLLIW